MKLPSDGLWCMKQDYFVGVWIFVLKILLIENCK